MSIELGSTRPGQKPGDRLLFQIKEVEEFRKHLWHQQVMASRNSHCCSLLLFHPQGNGKGKNQVQQLIEGSARRLRETDEMGWFDTHRFGVLLLYTHQADAQHLAEEICKTLSTPDGPIPYEVYTCPGKGQHENVIPTSLEGPEVFNALSVNNPDPLLDASNWLRTWPGTTWPETLDSPGPVDQQEQATTLSPMPIWKRTLDIVGAAVALILALPILVAAAAMIKCFSRGPVFFKQHRLGYKGRKFFIMWKLRTYHMNSSHDDHKQYLCRLILNGRQDSGEPMKKLDNHPGIIRFGNLLRKTCIDELPQLINVLMGDMSLVGPRPALPYEAEMYAPWHIGRFEAIPGMTGLWQVKGKNRLTFDEMVRLDIQYIKNKSLLMDLWILLRTPLAIVEQLKDNLSRKCDQDVSVSSIAPIVETRTT